MGCPQCGAQHRDGARFCEDCGAQLPLTCPGCGAEVAAGKRFCGDCGARLELPTPAATPEAAALREERRWATVLFADLSGFTTLSERLDPEDVKVLAQRCAEQMAEQVHRCGGTLIDVMGDSVLAVFGAPVAHEDDPERAVRAGLAIRDCGLADPSGRPIEVHLGINTGEVMAGQIGPEQRRQYAVMGDTTNTAARLMSAAPPGAVLVGEETYRATRRLVRYRELPPVEAKGKQQPVPAWEALEIDPLPAARPLGTAPLVGRDDELKQLEGIWTRVIREARPHLVSVLGEPGIGKSRLVAEFERRVLREALVLHGRCLAYGEALGYWAIATALKEAAGISGEDDAEAARARLGALVQEALGSAETDAEAGEMARHLALLSGLDTVADRAAAAVDERVLRNSVRRFLEALARRQPLCLLLEDIHWADDALLDLIELVASRAYEAPLLIVTQARPELLEKRPAWGGGVRAFTSLPLEPLDEYAGRELVLALCRERGLSDELTDQVGRGAGGNPLFAEELVAMVAERGGPAGIPSAIKGLIAARLDGLPADERATLQRAAVLGKAFWVGGVEALGAPTRIEEQLDLLEQKDLVRAQSGSRFRGEREYVFKHDLIRDVAYETLPRTERRTLHGPVVDWMERVAGERVEECLDILAYHAMQADQPERAFDYLVRAAGRARRAAAHREEAALLTQALEVADRLKQGELVAELRAARGKAFARVGQWAAARTDLEAALDGLPPHRAALQAETLVDLSLTCYFGRDAAGLRRHATAALALAGEVGRDDLAREAMAWQAAALGGEGNLAASLQQFERSIERGGDFVMPPSQALAIYQATLYWSGQYQEGIVRGRQAVEAARGGADVDARVLSLAGLGIALAGAGRYGEAASVFDEARRVGHEYTIGPLHARTIAMSAGFHLDVYDFGGHEALAEEAREIARSYSFVPGLTSASIDLLMNLIRRQEAGRAEQIVDEVAETVEQATGFHGWLWRIRLAEARAELALARGDSQAARELASDAIEMSADRRPKYYVLALGTRARALAAVGRQTEAIADLRQAIELARPVGDPALFLRTAAALLALDGGDALVAEALAAADSIAASLPSDEMRLAFEAAGPVRLVRQLAR